LTHEIGHALGADHSGVLEATMFQATGMQQSHLRTLAPDDIAWASMMYPQEETPALFGSIAGLVRLSGANLFGAHAVAFDLPQFVVGGGYSSHLYLTNTGVTASTVRMTLIGSDGRPLVIPAAKILAPHSSIVMQPVAFGFPEANAASIPGYLRVEADGGAVIGSVTFEDVGGVSFLAGMNAVSHGATEAYISQVATGVYGYYTGVACVNTSEAQAQVQVLVYDAAGRQVALGKRTLAPGQRFSELLDQLTGFLGEQQGGYIQVLSTQPVVCFGVVGTENSLASVPAQIRGR
jgi:hypothetical protein